jgi:uncharacterized protein YdaU (DUF1376 family)
MNQAPAFQFYPADFLADENVVVMSLAGRGAYITLLCYCWREGSIPVDFTRMGRMCGVDSSAMAQLWEELHGCFEKAGDRYINPRLERERIKQAEHRNERRESGRKGAESRWGSRSTSIVEGEVPETPDTREDSKDNTQETPVNAKDGLAITQPSEEPIAVDGSSSSSSSSSSDPPSGDREKATSRAKARSASPRKSTVCDWEYLEDLQKNPAYTDLDVNHVFHKMAAWCQVRNKQPTRSRLINWLNREERPLRPVANGHAMLIDPNTLSAKTRGNAQALQDFVDGK